MNNNLNSIGLKKNPSETTVVVAMSGGVDTSVNYFTFDVTIPDGNWSTDTFVYYLNKAIEFW